MKRIAVLLCGEFRTWAIASQYLFNFFRGRAEQIDYYFVTWNTTTQTGEVLTVTEKDILTPFEQHGQKIFRLAILDQITRTHTTYQNQSWLVKTANILKRETEISEGFVYEQVVETRPDVYLRRWKNKSHDWVSCVDLEYEGGCPGHQHASINGWPTFPDYYFRTNSYTNDLLSNRYSWTPPQNYYIPGTKVGWNVTNHHWVMYQYVCDRRLLPRVYPKTYCNHYLTTDYDVFCTVRPNFLTDINWDDQPRQLLHSWAQQYKYKKGT
jgi:hypothetical protein